MPNSILFDGHEAVANLPASLATSLAGSAWSVEGWVQLPINYVHADDLILFQIGTKFSLYVEGTSGDLIFTNGVTSTTLTNNLLDSKRHYFVVTNNLTTSIIYIDSYVSDTLTTAETIAGGDVITVCDFVGRSDNYAFYDKVLTTDQIDSHYGSGRCNAVSSLVNLNNFKFTSAKTYRSTDLALNSAKYVAMLDASARDVHVNNFKFKIAY